MTRHLVSVFEPPAEYWLTQDEVDFAALLLLTWEFRLTSRERIVKWADDRIMAGEAANWVLDLSMSGSLSDYTLRRFIESLTERCDRLRVLRVTAGCWKVLWPPCKATIEVVEEFLWLLTKWRRDDDFDTLRHERSLHMERNRCKAAALRMREERGDYDCSGLSRAERRRLEIDFLEESSVLRDIYPGQKKDPTEELKAAYQALLDCFPDADIVEAAYRKEWEAAKSKVSVPES